MIKPCPYNGSLCRELEIEHPAAKMVVLGSQMQENEVGDATNFVIIFAGQLLKEAEDLIRYLNPFIHKHNYGRLPSKNYISQGPKSF